MRSNPGLARAVVYTGLAVEAAKQLSRGRVQPLTRTGLNETKKFARMSTVIGCDFETLVERAREGCDQAAWDLVEMYGSHILRVVRRHLSREMRPKYDSQDFVQAVWMSFFTDADKLRDVDTPGQLIGLLAAIAKHKIIDESRRRLETERYNVRKERNIAPNKNHACDVMPSMDPTPSQFAVARERWNDIMDGLPEEHRLAIRLRMAGETYKTISEQVGISEKTVQRVLQRAVERIG